MKSTLVTACIYQARIELGQINPRDFEQSEPLNDFMFLYGNDVFNHNLILFASLLGYLKQVQFYNPFNKVYSEVDFKNQTHLNN